VSPDADCSSDMLGSRRPAMTFAELWQEAHRRHSSPGAQQAWLRSQLSNTLDSVGLRRAVRNGGARDRIVVGVAPDYSREDAVLLDRLARVAVGAFEVFFLADCASHEDIRRVRPDQRTYPSFADPRRVEERCSIGRSARICGERVARTARTSRSLDRAVYWSVSSAVMPYSQGRDVSGMARDGAMRVRATTSAFSSGLP
jgi:hypothetical protein